MEQDREIAKRKEGRGSLARSIALGRPHAQAEKEHAS